MLACGTLIKIHIVYTIHTSFKTVPTKTLIHNQPTNVDNLPPPLGFYANIIPKRFESYFT